ncbi:MAG: dihydroorotate dehydrogenase electron transfer subunit [Oscillospiraceae bacterium]|nr:dihydroorotate dehydrogenase electron transfer subunit [Oscillospiraceae bacterium]
MKDSLFTISEQRQLTESVFEMKLTGDTSAITRPGQFVNLRLDGLYLRRPISVCNLEGNRLTLVYKVVGKGTAQLSKLQPGQQLPVLTGLGNGYDTALSGARPLLIGGGVGVPPLYLLAKHLRAEDKQVCVILGFNTASELFYLQEFKALGCEVRVTTVDGSLGVKGFVTDALPERYTHVYTCGPEPMLKAVYRSIQSGGSFSFEKRMGCGFGACMGCSCKTITGYKRICKEGPVLQKEEILWED